MDSPFHINARNVNEALSTALHWLRTAGAKEHSRNGPVLVAPGPVTTTYREPWERVLFSPRRDANPFFHLMEALWMLAGRDDLAWPRYFNSRFKEYSDDGETVHDAYGKRWRSYFKTDQIRAVADELRVDPLSRRAVLGMWDSEMDLRIAMAGGRAIPCNTHAYFDLRNSELNMTVCCRSNDALWGAYGANAVHFSVLQEYVAAILQVPIGTYTQFSNNFHIYLDVLAEEDIIPLAQDADVNNLYARGDIVATPLVNGIGVEAWDKDLVLFMADPAREPSDYIEPFFRNVAAPMYAAWRARKQKDGDGLEHVAAITAPDWKIACTHWIKRRKRKA